MTPSRKQAHISQLIHHKLGRLLQEEAHDPRFNSVTISRVKTSPDVSSAKIHFSCYPPQNLQNVAKALNQAAGFFSRLLGRSLHTRNTPRLQFIPDLGFSHADNIDRLLKKSSPISKEN